MHRSMTLKQRITLGLAAFLLALAAQIFLSFYQSGTVLRELDDQMGRFNAISRFQDGVERSLTALSDYRWEYGDADELLMELDAAFSTTNAWLWRIDGDLSTVSEGQYLLYNAVCTTYKSYTALVKQLEEAVREKAGALPTYVEDTPVALWSVVDYIDVMVHIMGQETREFYGMDTLWKDAPVVEY